MLGMDEFIEHYVKPFESCDYLYTAREGWIVWRMGTGRNVELLHIRTALRGQGLGRRLFYHMLDRLSDNPPYHSVFGFTRSSNEEAKAFYGALGFNLQTIDGLYKDGSCICFSQSYETLLIERQTYEDSLRR